MGATIPAANGELVPVKTEKQAHIFFRNLAKTHKPGAPVPTDSSSHAWLLWLVQGHYHYVQLCPDGVDHFVVYVNSDLGFAGNDRGFSVVARNSDGHPREFSFKEALRGTEKTHNSKVSTAFRSAVDAQIVSWKAANYRSGLVCPVLGMPMLVGAVHVDHCPPFTFAELVKGFLEEQGLKVEDLLVEDYFDPQRRVHYWRLSEPVLGAWQQYHLQNMRLQVLSVEGHRELERRRRDKGA
jgi:hypothetical protein